MKTTIKTGGLQLIEVLKRKNKRYFFLKKEDRKKDAAFKNWILFFYLCTLVCAGHKFVLKRR